MSAVPQEISRPQLKPGQALLVGRISDVKRTDKAVYTIVQTPAPDSYSSPGNHEIMSTRMIGKPGEDVRVIVSLGGYRRNYTDKHGERQTAVDNVLRLVDE